MSVETSMWSPLQQGSVSDLIADRILEVIAKEELQPGERLPSERELAALLGASRPSLREALRSLKSSGHVEIRRGAGVYVADPATTRTLREAMHSEQMSLAELFDMREVLEVPAAGWAAQHQDLAKLAKVSDAFEALDAAAAEKRVNWTRIQQLDAAFHLAIVEAAGNRFMTRTLGVLQEILARGMETTLRIPGRLETSRGDHARIHRAVRDGDATAARAATEDHIRGARDAAFARVSHQADAEQIPV